MFGRVKDAAATFQQGSPVPILRETLLQPDLALLNSLDECLELTKGLLV